MFSFLNRLYLYEFSLMTKAWKTIGIFYYLNDTNTKFLYWSGSTVQSVIIRTLYIQVVASCDPPPKALVMVCTDFRVNKVLN